MPAMVSQRRRLARRLARGRRGRRLLVTTVAAAVLVALAVGIASQVGRQSRPYDRAVDISFSRLVGPLGTRSAATGAELSSALRSAAGATRSALLSMLANAARTAAQTATDAAAATPPVPPAAGAADCQRALAERAAAAGGVRQAVEELLGGPAGDAAVAGSARAAATRAAVEADSLVTGADAEWSACRRSLHRAPGRPLLPRSSWVSAGGVWGGGTLAATMSAVATSPSLAAAPALAIEAVTTNPPALSASGSPPTYGLPAAAAVSVRVVIDDTGNVALPHVVVRATDAGGQRTSSRQATVALGAGGSTVVDIGGIGLLPGTSGTITVSATASGTAAAPATLAVSVAKAATAAAVAASANPVRVGQPVTYTATITGSLTSAGSPTGTVAFVDAGTPVPGCTARRLTSSGTATCRVTYTSAAYHSISVVYDGTASLGGTIAPAITETVRPPARPAGSSATRSGGSAGRSSG